LGFGGDKSRAFLELVGNIISGRINFNSLNAKGRLRRQDPMDNEAVVASLLELRGVGRWTAEYVLVRGLKPLNVFPGDVFPHAAVGSQQGRRTEMNRRADVNGLLFVTTQDGCLA
jgi:3-methyladenine DNA glycosylase/8-oxoguanine DNA glycosylase